MKPFMEFLTESKMSIGSLVRFNKQAKAGFPYGKVKGFKMDKDAKQMKDGTITGKVDSVTVTLLSSPLGNAEDGGPVNVPRGDVSVVTNVPQEIANYKAGHHTSNDKAPADKGSEPTPGAGGGAKSLDTSDTKAINSHLDTVAKSKDKISIQSGKKLYRLTKDKDGSWSAVDSTGKALKGAEKSDPKEIYKLIASKSKDVDKIKIV